MGEYQLLPVYLSLFRGSCEEKYYSAVLIENATGITEKGAVPLKGKALYYLN